MLAKMWSNWNTHTLLMGLYFGTITWKTAWCYLLNLKFYTPCDLAVSIPGVYPIEIYTYTSKYMHKDVHSAITHNSSNWNPNSINGGIGKWMRYICTMVYYPAMKINKLPVHEITVVNLTYIILIRISQTQTNIYCMIPFM